MYPFDDDDSPFILKIKDGTTRGDANLCLTCRNSHITLNRNNREVTRCTWGRDFIVTAPIAKCNKYDDKTLPALYDLREIAWTVETDKKTKQVGFCSPEEMRKRKERE